MPFLRLPLAFSAAVVLIAGASASPVNAQSEPRFGTRSVRTCAPVKAKPTVVQAAALIQCHQEHKSSSEIVLLTDVRVEMGGSQPYNYHAHSHLTAVDTTSQVYPIRGSYTWYDCGVIAVYPAIHSDNRGKNCITSLAPAGKGFCWLTTFGSWDCVLNDVDHHDIQKDQPPPRS